MGDIRELNYELDFSGRLPVSAQEGMARADENADPKWKHMWDCCVLKAAEKKPEITSDDVLAEYERLKHQPGTHNLAAIGPAMRRAAKMGILIGTNRTERSQRPEKNGNLHLVWTSNYFKPEAK